MLETFIEQNKGKAVQHDIVDQIKELLNIQDGSEEIKTFLTHPPENYEDDGYDFVRNFFIATAKEKNEDIVLQKIQNLNQFEVSEILMEICESDEISYQTFNKFAQKILEKNPDYKYIISPSLFINLPQADQKIEQSTQNIKCEKYVYKADLLKCLIHTINACKQKLELDEYSMHNFIERDNLESYIESSYECYDNKIKPELKPYYTFYVTEAIFFLLDPKRTGRVDINILCSSFYLENALTLQPENLGRVFGPLAEKEHQGIFTYNAFVDSYEMFEEACAHSQEQNGLLQKDQMSHLPFSPTKAFADAMFFYCETFDNCIDFRVYVDYLLAMTFPCNLSAGYYVFNILTSVSGKNYLTRQDLKYFFGSIFDDMCKMFSEVAIPEDDFVDEIYDNVKPKDKNNIYFTDIQRTHSSEFLVRYMVSLQSLMEKETFAQTASPVLNDVPWSGSK